MITRRERFWMVLSVALAIVLLVGGRTLPSVNAGINDSDLFKQLKLFTDVMSVVQRDYFKEVGSEELVSGAIKGMLTTLDPHSSYLDPSFYNDLQVETSGEFGGLGIEITLARPRQAVKQFVKNDASFTGRRPAPSSTRVAASNVSSHL